MGNGRPSSGRLYDYSQISFDNVSDFEGNPLANSLATTPRDASEHLEHQRNDSFLRQSSSGTATNGDVLSKQGHTQRKQTSSSGNRVISMGWWWEVASAFLGIICTSLIVAILFSMDGKSIENWRLPIQPNSLVAVFSTIAKSALLYPLAECIGQLKWEYFDTTTAKPLSQLYAFDTASRGPWGAFKFTWSTRGRALLASMGAAITVLMLAFEPFTQQVIAFSARNVLLHNETANVLVTNTWFQTDKSDYEKVTYPLTTGISGSIVKPMPLEPASSFCPTSQCRFQDFTTLGVCSECTTELVNNDYFDSCNYNATFSGMGHISYSSLSQFQDAVRQGLESKKYQNGSIWDADVECRKWIIVRPGNPPGRIYFSTTLHMYWWGHYENGQPPNVRLESPLISQVVPNVTEDLNRWYQSWDGETKDIQPYTGSVRYLQIFRLSSVQTESPTEIKWFRGFNSTTELGLYSDPGEVGVINGTMSFCHVDFCAHTYKGASVENGRWSISSIEETTLNQTGVEEVPNNDSNAARDRKNITFSATGVADGFRIGEMAFVTLYETIETVFGNEQFEDGMHMAPFNHTINGNWTELTRRIASALSAVLSSPGNLDARNITGEAYGQKVFVQVHWPWLIGPLSMVILSVIFLVLTIVESSRKPYLFKTSIMAVLFHGLEGWDLSGSQAEIDGRKKTERGLLMQAKEMRVRLRQNEEGSLKLKKE
ncbi:hypothetical protein K505DRAFT_1967 [Melanomma pulvis-pyrius CBS 109.77]|uniref:Uncharacterized protein n=1 Tax=Melanomma pulvis-pyrius CBS 109.77 TaxID=1314802 RepID=A0A6A6XIE7_9PLEO|nr:hypothetical protein K505DRAFT_1967 [Melanomma pulvis-pyrius CBS 109.77]